MGFKKLLTKKIEFSASHRYWNPNITESENIELYGKAASQSGHGHNFQLEVTVEGEIDENTGMIINLFDLKEILKEILKKFDHKYLNEDNISFKNLIPTPENIAKTLWNIIDKELEKKDVGCSLYKIRLYETDDLYVDYWREK